MVNLITKGVSISVKIKFREKHSNPMKGLFVFSYFITIENQNDFTVQLLRRKWKIFDSSGGNTEVEGKGVVGEQPIILPGEHYSYESACSLVSPIGRMYGNYLMARKTDNKTFKVEIPEFELVVPFVLN